MPSVSKIRPMFRSDSAIANTYSIFFFICHLFVCFSYKSLIRDSGDLEITVDFLTEVDKLVQLIESPIFACEYLCPDN